MERAQRSYSSFCNEDGSFLLADIPAGTYELKIEIAAPKQNSLGASRLPFDEVPLGFLVTEVVVPEIPAGRTDDLLNLGTMELKPKGPPGTVGVLGHRP